MGNKLHPQQYTDIPEELVSQLPDASSVKWSREVDVARADRRGRVASKVRCSVFMTSSTILWSQDGEFKGKLSLHKLQVTKDALQYTLTLTSESRGGSLVLHFEQYDEYKKCKTILKRMVKLARAQRMISDSVKNPFNTSISFLESPVESRHARFQHVHMFNHLAFGAVPIVVSSAC